MTSGFEDLDDGFFRPSVSGLTPYQPGKPVEDVQRELGLERVIKLASNEGPFGPFPAALEAIERGAPRAQPLSRRRASTGCTSALASRHGVALEEICVGAGADGCIDMLSQAILDPGDEIVCGWPSFPSYVIYARKQGAEAAARAARDHRYDLDALLDAVTPRTKLVYICHPNNPTGTMNTPDELDAYFERVPGARAHRRRPGVLRVHRPARLSGRRRAVPQSRRPASSCCARSRRSTAWPGCASATPSAPRAVCAAMAKVRRPFDVTTPAQVAALASIGDEAELARRRAVNTDGSCPPRGDPRATMASSQFPRSATSSTSKPAAMRAELFERLLHEGVIVRPLRRLRLADRDSDLGREHPTSSTCSPQRSDGRWRAA